MAGLAGGLLSSGGAVAVDCSGTEYAAFDFWLGRWEVAIADGRKAGTNVISRTEDGCLIHEAWSSVGGGRGFSMNYYDPSTDLWRQLWVSAASIIDISGRIEDGAMTLVGEIRYRETREVLPFRGSWRLLEDGRVRQLFEERRNDTWDPWFEGFYSKAVE